MRKKRVAIFHFQPIELYPPTLNLLVYFESQINENTEIRIYTNAAEAKFPVFKLGGNKRVLIKRYGKLVPLDWIFFRYYEYLKYNIACLFDVLLFNPQTVLYFETTSAMIPLIWFRLFGKKGRLFIHYHEYISPSEYRSNSLLFFLNQYEKKLYPNTKWISHTNHKRCELFLRDMPMVNSAQLRIVPNYPPRQWTNFRKEKGLTMERKIVYVGAVGLDSMFLRQFSIWVESKKGALIWDIYSQQDTSELQDFLIQIESKHINVNGYVRYEELPLVLTNYHIGVILYNAVSENFIYNAPNKLFEYLICGLDVWYPEAMEGIYSFNEFITSPRVIPVDFDDANSLDYAASLCKDFKPLRAAYCAEDVLLPLKDELLSDL